MLDSERHRPQVEAPAVENDPLQYSRISLNWEVVLSSAQKSIVGVLKSVSPADAVIHCKEQPEPDEIVRILVEVPEQTRTLRIVAKVTKATSHGIAVRFTEVSNGDTRFLYRIIADTLHKALKKKMLEQTF